jgi:hypothetical protein
MKVGIDSYCYHRFFGEVYPDQKKPAKDMTMQDFLTRAKEHGAQGVSLESCFFPPNIDKVWFKDLKAQLDDYKFERVYAWGAHRRRCDAGGGEQPDVPPRTAWPPGGSTGKDV